MLQGSRRRAGAVGEKTRAGIFRRPAPCDKIGETTHENSPPRSPARRSHRRRRGDRAAGRGRQGTDRERSRRRREGDRCGDRGGRPAPHPRDRRRARHGRIRPRALGRAARDLENPRRRSDRDRHLRLPRRGAALDRLRLPAGDPHPDGGRADGLEARRRGRGEEPGRALRRGNRHAGRGARPVRGDAGEAQVPQIRPERSAGGRRRRQAAGARPSRGPLRLFDRYRRFLRVAGLRRRRNGQGRAPASGARDAISPRIRLLSTRRARACGSRGGSACRPSAGRTRSRNSSSSTAGPCATRLSPARCGRPTWISCPPTGTRSWPCSSNATRAMSTSTSIPPRRKCASATPAWCAASSSGR